MHPMLSIAVKAARRAGNIINRENIGKTSEELVAKWNEDHPDDQVPTSD